MGINNDFANAYSMPTITAGICEIIHDLLSMETNRLGVKSLILIT